MSARKPWRIRVAALTVLLALGCGAPAAARKAPAHARNTTAPRAPSGPPLVTSAPGAQAFTGEGASPTADASSSAPASGGDPLVENGLGSPLCGDGADALSAASRANCATSGFEAAGAPTGDYGLDVHIDTGALGFTAATLEQDYLIGPVWMGLVWIVHTLVVALEWCFTLDLLGGSTMDGLERSLRDAQTGFTRPWLVLALALASIAAAYNGLVRRRVAETLGQVALMVAMIIGGLWVIADPVDTVGALGRWVDAASVGTFATVVEGSPARAPRTLADSMGGLFAGVIDAPWCYLEFGDVSWCSEPALLDPPLHAAALRIAAAAQPPSNCGADSISPTVCQALEGEQPAARAQSARLLRSARTNGELFLALPADQAARNSINDRASLLSVLCGGSSDATDCRGPTAQEAEFRTQGGTASRVGGLLLISLGALGMLLLLGFIALHLLGSELIGLIYLLLAPVAVIAPALGDGGRAAFRAWAARLVGAVTSKLLFSFLLGVVLLLTRTLMALPTLGWWTRWLLVSSMWWGAYCQRRLVLGFFQGELRAAGDRPGGAGQRMAAVRAEHRDSVARRVQRQLESPIATARAARWVRGKLARPAPGVAPGGVREDGAGVGAGASGGAGAGGSARARAAEMGQATLMLEREYQAAREELADAPRVQAQIRAKSAQLVRIQAAQDAAESAGDKRRVAALSFRAERVEGEIARDGERLSNARQTVSGGERSRRGNRDRAARAAVKQRARFLDAQAALPAGGRRVAQAHVHGGAGAGTQSSIGDRAPSISRRDYAALASLVGYGREQYEQLDPRHRREARLRIDRELAQRRERLVGSTSGAAVRREDQTRVAARVTSASPQRVSSAADASPSRSVAESPVMRDAHEVARGRKRQLGYDR
ncbi:MAG TPA: hypothetical protein VGL37_04935 [Solirubrobacteraceae bacterium]